MHLIHINLIRIINFYLSEEFFTSCMCEGASVGSLRVIGGRDVKDNEFPYVVRLEERVTTIRNGNTQSGTDQHYHKCTASVLTKTVAMTAAHCSMEVKQQELESKGVRKEKTAVIRYGSTSSRPTDNDRFSDVLSFINIPSNRSYNHPLIAEDLALMTTQPILLSSYARISAVDHHTLYGQRVTILGYGVTNGSRGIENTLILKKPLQAVDAMLSKCNDDHQMMYPVICANEPCGYHIAICSGDSGGPVLHASGIIGVTSRGYNSNCQMKKNNIRVPVIDIISPLSTHIDWIMKVTQQITFF